MKTTQKLIGLIVFLLIGISAVAAQDLIILRDGNVIEARVTEISTTEIRYRRFDFLDGPIFVAPVANVLSIRFEGGTVQVFNQAAPAHVATAPAAQQRTRAEQQFDWDNRSTAIDPDIFIFSISANAGGVLGGDFGGGGGLRIELGRGNFNADVLLGGNIGVGSGFVGFVGLATFNYFWHSRLGGFYLGGGLGTNPVWEELWSDMRDDWVWTGDIRQTFTIGLNTGYKFVTRVGFYFRVGAFLGAGFILGEQPEFATEIGPGSTFEGFGAMRRTRFILNPDISFGWTMR
ncbi:MAG: hypothetical protein FWC97_06685 [Treponema sp.]|nr:hypothetical protein [Treponema sp.]